MKFTGKAAVRFARQPWPWLDGTAESKEALYKECIAAAREFFMASGKLQIVAVIALSRTHPELAEIVKKEMDNDAECWVDFNHSAAGAPSVGFFVAGRLIANIVMPASFAPGQYQMRC
jgi:hypothetical protein